MKFKLIMAMVGNDRTDRVMKAAREAGATGCTILTNARGEGLKRRKTFLGLDLAEQHDLVMMLVEEHLSRHILETVGAEGRFEEEAGGGIAFMLDIEDAVGLSNQVTAISTEIEDEI